MSDAMTPLPPGPALDEKVAQILGWRYIGPTPRHHPDWVLEDTAPGSDVCLGYESHNRPDGTPPPFSSRDGWAWAGHVSAWLRAQGFEIHTEQRQGGGAWTAIIRFMPKPGEMYRWSVQGESIPHALALAFVEAAAMMTERGVPVVAVAVEEWPNG